jgi:hypothetical protein
MENNRYEDVTEDVNDKLEDVRHRHFSWLKNASIKVIFDTKKRVAGGQMVLGKIVKPNDLVDFFCEGYDYIIILDKVCWNNITETDRERIMRHELRHVDYDIEDEKDPYKLVDHEITDFYDEVTLNQDDPRWKLRVVELTCAIYEQRAEEARETKKPKKKIASLTNMTITVNGKTPIEE